MYSRVDAVGTNWLMERSMAYTNDLNLKATELRLGLPGSDEPAKPAAAPITPSFRSSNKRSSPEISEDLRSKCNSSVSNAESDHDDRGSNASRAKAHVAGWPPIQSFRKNCLQAKKNEGGDGAGMYVKVSMDGAPYLRKIDLKVYKSYPELLKALENMFKLSIGEYSEREGYSGSDYAPTYEDKDGDWMLVGDVPWGMFISSCKRLRIMRGSEAKGMGCS